VTLQNNYFNKHFLCLFLSVYHLNGAAVSIFLRDFLISQLNTCSRDKRWTSLCSSGTVQRQNENANIIEKSKKFWKADIILEIEYSTGSN